MWKSATNLRTKYAHKLQNITGKIMTILKWEEVDRSNEVSDRSEDRRTPKLQMITHRMYDGSIWEQ